MKTTINIFKLEILKKNTKILNLSFNNESCDETTWHQIYWSTLITLLINIYLIPSFYSIFLLYLKLSNIYNNNKYI